MTLREFVGTCNHLSLYEERCVTEESYIVVFYAKDNDDWCRILVNAFGNPIKPAGVKPTKEHEEMTSQHGGIMKNQTLFYTENAGGQCVLAMLWPWQDNKHTTLIVAVARS